MWLLLKAVLATRAPLIFEDAQSDERIPESGRQFFVRTLIRSAAVLPLQTYDDVVGVLSLASLRPNSFSGDERELSLRRGVVHVNKIDPRISVLRGIPVDDRRVVTGGRIAVFQPNAIAVPN